VQAGIFFMKLLLRNIVCHVVLFFVFIVFLLHCKAGDVTGVTDSEIVIGQSCVLAGPAAILGKELRDGALAYFKQVNQKGGVFGRKIRLISYDDAYEPVKCIANTKKLIHDDKVFLLFSYVGTPTSKAVVFFLDENNHEIPYLTPFTGAELLRQPVRKHVFNLRSSYYQETDALVKYFIKNYNYADFAVFYQDDSYGRAGLDGVRKALGRFGTLLKATGTYKRNSLEVKDAVKKISEVKPEFIIMIGAYAPCAEFIKKYKRVDPSAKFANISFVGSLPLAEKLGQDGDGVIVSQVVPLAEISSKAVTACEKALGRKPAFGELEGYLNAAFLCAVLKQAGKKLTRQKLEQTIEAMENDKIEGLQVSFSPSNHQGFNEVYLTVIKDGKYQSLETKK
jgi:ABC-type branched-subunit amino acid transport system substrate-binding protein